MKKALVIVFALCLSVPMFAQQGLPDYYRVSEFFPTSPGSMRFGLNGYDNPAMLSTVHGFDAMYSYQDNYPGSQLNPPNRWGLFIGTPAVGFGMISNRTDSTIIQDYRLSFAAGNGMFGFGFGFGWSNGNTAFYDRKSIMTVGIMLRPNPYVSLGIFGASSWDGEQNEGVADLSIRPFGTELLTVFADHSIREKQTLWNGGWSVGAAVEAIPGLRLSGRYFDTKFLSVGVQLSIGTFGVGVQSHFDADRERAFNTNTYRTGGYDRNIIDFFSRPKNYLKIDLNGQLGYRKFAFMDKSHTLIDILNQIDAAKTDEGISGIAINTSGMTANREMLWEVREKLREFKATGKRVIMFVDVAGMDEYHFASVADRIIMDPQGRIMLPGYVAGRTFLKGTLEKLGIGFDEWRFFKYKSAVESYSRDSMSPADREQRLKFISDNYALAKREIAQGRKVQESDVDKWINEQVIFMPSDALAGGLIDSLGRWEEVESVMKSLNGKHTTMVSTASLDSYRLPSDNRWGGRKTVAVIYALGECAMDQGITARKLVKDVESAVNDPFVSAIVFRVDSPGGDGMASDIVAEALRKGKGKKPIIVSQGAVAASGGYWLSMYADTIVAAPNTLTGSVGVIGGWYYNKELKEKLGMTTDFVKTGNHADLGFGMTLPLIGLGLPDRNLTTEERAVMERSIKAMYKDFVQKVATGRHKKTEEIEAIAEGHIFSGTEGRTNGLVDVLGGLSDAIRIARERAGIATDERIDILELPKQGFFNLNVFSPKLFGIDVQQKDPVIESLLFRFRHNGQPLPMVPLEEMNNE